MATKTINQKITISGGDEIARTLRDLARLGEQAFAQLADAAKKIDLNLPVDKVKEQLVELGRSGQQAFGQLADAAQKSVSSVKEVGTASQGSAKAVAEISPAAQKVAQDVAAIGPAAQQGLGGIQQQASAASSALSNIGTAVKVAGATLAGLAATFTGLAAAASAMGKSASDAVISIGRSADAAKVSVENFSRANLLLQQFGLTADQSAAAIKRLGEAGKAAFDSAVQSMQRLSGAGGETTTALQRALQGTQQTLEQIARTGTGAAERVAQGAKVIVNEVALQNEATRAKFAAQMASMADITVNGKRLFDEGTAAILKYAGAFNEVTGAARRPTEMLTELADRLQKIPSAAERVKVLTAIFNELGPVMGKALERGTAAFVNMIGTIDRLGLKTTEVERKVGQDFRAAWDLLQAVIAKNNQEIGLLIAKPLTPFIEKFAEAMRRGSDTFKIYEAAVNAVMPVIGKFLDEIAKIGKVDATFPETLKKGVEEFGNAIGAIFTNVIRPAFTGMIKLATEAANVLTTMFGTEVTPIMVALGVALTLLLGPIKAVGVALLAVFGSGVGTAGFDQFKESLRSFGIDIDKIKLKIEEVIKDIRLLVAGKEGEVKNQWLIAIKDALVSFKNEIGPTTIALTALIGFLVRTVGPARLAQAAFLHMTGALTIIRDGVAIVAFSMSALVNAFNLLGPALRAAAASALAFGPLLTPMGVALRAVAAAVLIVATNLDTLLAAWKGIEALGTGNVERAEKAFGLMGVGAKQAQAGVQELRAELQKDPNLTGWEKTQAFFSGFVKGELDAIARDWDRFWNQELPSIGAALHRLVVQPFKDMWEIIRIAFEIMLIGLRNKWGEFIASIRQGAGPLKGLLPAADTDEQIEQRIQQVQRLKERVEQLMGVAPTDKVRQAFDTMERDAKRVADAVTSIGDKAQTSFREIRPGVFEKVVTDAKETVQKVEATFREIRPGVFERISSDAKDTATKVNDAFRQIRPGVFEKIATDAKTATTTVQQQATETKEKLTDAITIDPTKPLSELQKLEEGLKRYAAELLAAKEKVDALNATPVKPPEPQGAPLLSQPIIDSIDQVKDAVADQADEIEDALTAPYEQALQEINEILDNIKTEVKDTFRRFDEEPEFKGTVEDRRGEFGPFQTLAGQAAHAAETILNIFVKLGDQIQEDLESLQDVEVFEPLVNQAKDVSGRISAELAKITAENPFGDLPLQASSAVIEVNRALAGLTNGMVAPFQAALDQIKAKIAEVSQALQQLGSGVPGAAAAVTGTPGEDEGKAAGGGLGGIGQQLVAGLEAALAQIQGMVQTAIQNIVAQFQTLGEQIAAALATVAVDPFQPLVLQAQNAVSLIVQTFAQLGQALIAPLEAMRAGFDAMLQGIGQLVTATFESINAGITSAAAAVNSAIQQIISALQAAVAEAQALAAAAQRAAAEASAARAEAGGFARGGYTGDGGVRRVAGVVHGGEYVEPAHVVRQPGVRAFLETLRRVGNLREALRRFSKGFSVGGFVDDLAGRMSGALVPGYASGGLVTQPVGKTAPRNLGVLRLDAGGERFEVMADESTAFKLQRFARRQLMTSGGRAPVWER